MRLPAFAATLVLLALNLLPAPTPAAAQGVLTRSPGLSGGWTGTPGTIQFNFLHRFWTVDTGREDKLVNSPTFLIAAPLPGRALIGFQYASNSLVDGVEFNEFELLGRWAALDASRGDPLTVAVTGAWNEASSSGDVELTAARQAGRLTLVAAARYHSDMRSMDDDRWALGGGASVRITDHIALAADVVSLTDRDFRDEDSGEAREADVAWSAGLQTAIPFTPHTFSFHASNARTGSLQGSSSGDGQVRYGFEFTIPFTLSRYFGRRSGQASPQPAAAGASIGAVVDMTDQLRFVAETVTIRRGEAVRWTNGSQLLHTVTADPGKVFDPANVLLPEGAEPWDSGLLEPGQEFVRVFTVPGEYRYFCVPHQGAGMVGTVIVRP